MSTIQARQLSSLRQQAAQLVLRDSSGGHGAESMPCHRNFILRRFGPNHQALPATGFLLVEWFADMAVFELTTASSTSPTLFSRGKQMLASSIKASSLSRVPSSSAPSAQQWKSLACSRRSMQATHSVDTWAASCGVDKTPSSFLPAGSLTATAATSIGQQLNGDLWLSPPSSRSDTAPWCPPASLGGTLSSDSMGGQLMRYSPAQSAKALSSALALQPL